MTPTRIGTRWGFTREQIRAGGIPRGCEVDFDVDYVLLPLGWEPTETITPAITEPRGPWNADAPHP